MKIQCTPTASLYIARDGARTIARTSSLFTGALIGLLCSRLRHSMLDMATPGTATTQYNWDHVYCHFRLQSTRHLDLPLKSNDTPLAFFSAIFVLRCVVVCSLASRLTVNRNTRVQHADIRASLWWCNVQTSTLAPVSLTCAFALPAFCLSLTLKLDPSSDEHARVWKVSFAGSNLVL
ncbi:hypothetical protein EDB83DRAFT_2635682 [Lactarius deliciosus]|nr:hypothetical protein EDB83DRAFT_2635682 [Lactarius deliciosus]